MKRFLPLSILCIVLSFKAFGQPAGWNYTIPYLITENSGSLVTNYQARLTINTSTPIGLGQMLANGDDIRFGKDCGGNVLYNYWIESGINTASTVIWVKIDTLFASSSRTFYLFYGNASATAASAIPGTFVGPMSSTDSVASGGAGGATNSQRGFRFSPNEDILVSAFGKRDPNGTTRYVTLFNFATQAIISQQQVSGPAGQYSYQNIASPIWLTNGTQYVLELYQGSSDGYYFGTSSQAGQQITYLDMRYCNSCTQNTFPTNILGNYHYGYPDFWYWRKNSVTPAPTIAPASNGLPLAVSGSSPTAYCSGGSVVISGSATGGSPGYTYSWLPTTDLSATNIASVTANPTVTTTYTLSVTDLCGTVVTTAITVTVNPLPAVIANATSTNVCTGDSLILTGSGTATSYSWSGGVTDGVQFPLLSSGTYTVTGTDALGCSSTDMITITLLPLPTVTATGSYSTICDNLATTITLSATGASTYAWNPGSGSGSTFVDTPTSSTTYTVIGTDAMGCSNSATYAVTINPSPSVTITASAAAVCQGTCDTLMANASGGTPGYSYLWTPSGNTTATLIDCSNISACHTVTVTDMNGCSNSMTQCYSVNALPVVAITGPDSLCAGSTGNYTGSGANTYDWNSGSMFGTTVPFTPLTSTTLTVVGTDANGCSNIASLPIVVSPIPTVTFTSSVDTVCSTDPIFNLTGGSPAGGTYSGTGVSANSFTPSVAGIGSHTITYDFTSSAGCSSSATHVIVVDPCTGIKEQHSLNGVSVYPNPFSTSLIIERSNTSNATINIYDVNGKLVLSTSSDAQRIEISTVELSTGMYSVQLIDNAGIESFRVIRN